ncbi:MAG: hypothetical protein U9R65_08915 [Pseudomonadota bacterium]|nr:hypothetical protein [Pseudomonadota bacterium]
MKPALGGNAAGVVVSRRVQSVGTWGGSHWVDTGASRSHRADGHHQ